MNLGYLAIDLDRNSFDIEYCYEFTLHTRFISNYLSKKIRKSKFVTDGTFRMISVRLCSKNCNGVFLDEDVVQVMLPFDKARYEQIKGTDDCEYYLEMFEKGFKKASEFKEIPLQTLLDFIQEFRDCGYKNEWLHKKKRFKHYDIEIALDCYFTTLDFQLVATITKLSTKEELCSGVVLKTEPDEICFDKEFKDILIDERNIIVTDFIDKPRILIDLEKANNKELISELLPDNSEDEGEDFDSGIVMTKLYKNSNGVINYYEAWDNDKEVIVHWGELGQVGEMKTIGVPAGKSAEGVIEEELTVARSQGYKEIDSQGHKTFVIQYKTETWGDEKDLEKRYKVENLVNECLGWTGNGHCDGGQIGSGSMEIFAYVIDPRIACRNLIDKLEANGFLKGSIIAFENDDEEFVVLYPKDFQGEFNML